MNRRCERQAGAGGRGLVTVKDIGLNGVRMPWSLEATTGWNKPAKRPDAWATQRGGPGDRPGRHTSIKVVTQDGGERTWNAGYRLRWREETTNKRSASLDGALEAANGWLTGSWMACGVRGSRGCLGGYNRMEQTSAETRRVGHTRRVGGAGGRVDGWRVGGGDE